MLRFKQGTRTTAQVTRTMKYTTPFSRIFKGVARAMGLPSRNPPIFVFDGKPLEPRQTPSELNMRDGDTIAVTPISTGVKIPHRKPVIYLFSPTDIDATVSLTLNDEWSLSVIYPMVPIKVLENGQGSQIQWHVRTHQDGSLTALDTSLDVSYLFWEAEYVFDCTVRPSISIRPCVFNRTHPRIHISSPSSSEHFNPVSCDLYDSDSVLLSVDDVTTYLDSALRVLGLHTEARTSFIT
jgi:hypothetical protein